MCVCMHIYVYIYMTEKIKSPYFSFDYFISTLLFFFSLYFPYIYSHTHKSFSFKLSSLRLHLDKSVCINYSFTQEWKWKSCLPLCDPMDYTLHGILQARILEWVAFPFSRGSSQPRDQTQVSHVAGRFFTSCAIREAHYSRGWQSIQWQSQFI